MLSLIKKLFYPIFFLLFLLSFFLIEGEYRFYLFALWAVFLLIFGFILAEKLPDWQNKQIRRQNHSKTIVFAIILSVLFVISTIFSKQIPLSLEKLCFYLIALAIFVFFKSFPKNHQNKFKPELFFYYLSIFTLTLNFFVLFFTFFDLQQELFPAMNLLTRNYGHNHYAAFLLLTIPVFWWQFLFSLEEKWASQKEMRILSSVLLFSSYLIVIFSLARIALVISLLQLMLIFLLNKKAFFTAKKSEFSQALVKAFVFTFLSISLFFLFLSIPLGQKGENFCPLIFDKKEICKPISQNDRFIYWQRAGLIFKENPLTGSGLKNFNFASRQFLMDSSQLTSYAHNIFLHNLAETGIFVGGFFIFFLLYLFYRSFLVMRKSGNKLQQFLWLAATASLLNAMFDFDFNFFVIFTLTLIFLAIILQDDPYDEKINIRIKLKTYFIFIVITSTFFAISRLATEILYKNNRQDLIIKYFPYVNSQIRGLLNEKKLKVDDFSNLHSLYKNDPEFLYRFSLLEDLTPEKKVALQVELAAIDPFSFISGIDFEKLNFQEALPLADKFIEVSQKNNFLNNIKLLDYFDQRNIAQQFFNFANQAYLANNPELAENYYQKALLLNNFIMGDTEAVFLKDTDYEKANIFLSSFKEVDPQKLGQYFYSYSSFYEKTLIHLFKNNQMDNFFILSEAMFEHEYNFSWFLWRDLIAESKTPEEKQRLLSVYDHYQEMSTWYDFLPL